MKLFGLFLSVPLVSVRAAKDFQQIPILGEAPNRVVEEIEKDVPGGIGIHFTTSYAVAVARYQNGTTRDLATIEADTDYIQVMSRWMDSYFDYKHMSKSEWEAESPLKFEAGTPAFEDMDVLPTFFSRVRIAVETELNAPISHVAVVTFPLQPLQSSVFMGALAEAGINTTETRSSSNFVATSEAQAAYAVLEQVEDPAHTASQAIHTHHAEHILFLSFDNSSFSASMHRLSPQSQQPRLITYAARSDLGWWNLPVFEVPRAKFWRKIQECIVDASKGLGKPPGRIVLTGNHGGDVEFKQQVEAALWNEFEFDVELLLKDNQAIDSAALAAKGAAGLEL